MFERSPSDPSTRLYEVQARYHAPYGITNFDLLSFAIALIVKLHIKEQQEIS